MQCLVMGIVNVTPDSFSDGGRFLAADAAVAHGLALQAQGAAILDVGGESTRPGAQRVDPAVEQGRVLPVVQALAAAGATVSIDTMNASTAVAAVEAGARIVNDVSGGLADPDMLAAVAGTDAELVVQHWRGHSADMYAGAAYDDIVAEVAGELERRVEAAVAAGVSADRVIIDPGIGFGKKGAQNWAVLHGMPRLAALGHRVLVGTSRKRFLVETLEARGVEASSPRPLHSSLARREEPPGAWARTRLDLATAVTSVLAAQAGAWAVRVHDVAGTVDALNIAAQWKSGASWTS